MTVQFLKSEIDRLPYDFEAEVKAQIKRLEDHRETGDAAPHSPYREVERPGVIVRRQYPVADKRPDDFMANYVIVPDPPLPLADRKAAARATLQAEEQAAIDAIIAPERVRLAQMKYARAAAVAEDKRSDGDRKAIADYEAQQKQIEAIRFGYAEREAAIADMT